MLPIVLDTVTLRQLILGDLAAFNAIYTNRDIRQYAEIPETLPLSRLFLLTQRPALELLVIESVDTGELIGWCGLSSVPQAAQPTCEAEIFLKPSAQGCGIGVKVLNKLRLIASSLGYQVQARVHVENLGSQRLMKKLRWFVQDGGGGWEVWLPPVDCVTH